MSVLYSIGTTVNTVLFAQVTNFTAAMSNSNHQQQDPPPPTAIIMDHIFRVIEASAAPKGKTRVVSIHGKVYNLSTKLRIGCPRVTIPCDDA